MAGGYQAIGVELQDLPGTIAYLKATQLVGNNISSLVLSQVLCRGLACDRRGQQSGPGGQAVAVFFLSVVGSVSHR